VCVCVPVFFTIYIDIKMIMIQFCNHKKMLGIRQHKDNNINNKTLVFPNVLESCWCVTFTFHGLTVIQVKLFGIRCPIINQLFYLLYEIYIKKNMEIIIGEYVHVLGLQHVKFRRFFLIINRIFYPLMT